MSFPDPPPHLLLWDVISACTVSQLTGASSYRPGHTFTFHPGHVSYGTRPLGAVAGGIIGSWIGIRPTLWIAAAGGIAGVLWLIPSPLPRFRMPEATDAANEADMSGEAAGDSMASEVNVAALPGQRYEVQRNG